MVAGVAALAVCYAWFLAVNGSSLASGSDESGYFNSARLLAAGTAGTPVPTIEGLSGHHWNPVLQQPLGFTLRKDTGQFIPTYPVGLPLHLLIAAQVVGWDRSAILVNVLGALASGLLLVLFGRRVCGLRWAWALASVAFLWMCPLFIFFSLQPMSDMPTTVWTLLAFYAADRSRERWSWAIVSGFAVGLSVLMRPTNALILLPLAVLLGGNWRLWIAMIAGGLPCALFQGGYNFWIYGTVLTSGYGDIRSLLQFDFVPPNASHFARWIPRLLTPLVLLALGLPWFLRARPRVVGSIIVWSVTLIGFYLFYFHSGETWWYLRFILPIFPFLLLAAAMVGQRLTDLIPQHNFRAGLIALIVIFGLNQQFKLSRELDVSSPQSADLAYLHMMDWLRQSIPADSIVVAMQASGALHYYTDFTLVRYDLMEPATFDRVVQAARIHGRPIYAPLFPFEIDPVVNARLGGKWKKVTSIDYLTIWRLQP